MTFGVSAVHGRLDADLPAGLAGTIDWDDFLAWNGRRRPSFAGKYFVGSPWRWVHGEATSLIDPVVAGAVLRIVPIQAPDAVRQAEIGDLGRRWGGEDGRAIGDAIANALLVGDLDLSANQPVPVYLEVAEGIALSSDYWTDWASAVRNAMIVGAVAGGGAVPPLFGQLLLPCLAITFVAGQNGWQPPPAVLAALEQPTSEGSAPGRCHGFWARTLPDSTPLAAQPSPSWATFADYRQPQPGGPPTRVPVLIWRYATGDPAAPERQVGRLTLETTQAGAGQSDPVLDGMLTAVAWRADDPGISPVTIGIDRGSSVLGDIDCLVRRDNRLTVRELPEPTLAGTRGRELPSPLEATPSFVGRYYSKLPTSKRRAPKDLTVAEAGALSDRSLDVVMFFQARVRENQVAAHLANPANGAVDGFAAGWFAAATMGQPAHTPIYFAVDCDVTTSGTSTFPAQDAITDQQLIDYFIGVNAGLAKYLAEQPKASRSPYAVGAYACSRAFDLLYPRGLAAHFWQAFPPFWGDDVVGVNSNLTAWPHLNLWQVALSGNVAVQARIGLTKCQRTFRFGFSFNEVEDPLLPKSIRVTKDGKVTLVPFPATPEELQKVTGGRVVGGRVQGSVLGYLIELDKRPAGFLIEAVPPFDAAFGPEFRALEGIADVDVAWGDTGGWRLPRGGL